MSLLYGIEIIENTLKSGNVVVNKKRISCS